MKSISILFVFLTFSLFSLQNLTAQENIGTFTLTDIPPQFNGTYATLMTADYPPDNSGWTFLLGGENIDVLRMTVTGIPISNGRVELPLWIISSDAESPDELTRYSGSHIFESIRIVFGLTSPNTRFPIFGFMPDFTRGIDFFSVEFFNGSATMSFKKENVFIFPVLNSQESE